MNLLLLLLITVPLITSLPTSSYPSCNPDHEFACSDSCIPLEFQCDHVKDCKSGEDEKGCEYLHNCRANDFMCRSGECISAKFKCNGDWDCADGSDENGCREWEMIRARKMMGLQSLPEVTTPKPEKCDFAFNFECRMSFECLPFSKRCNGVSDCVLGDDEEDCIDSLCFTDGYVKCDDDKHCVHEDHFCDGIANCPDGSDEKNCHFKYLPSPDEFFNTIQNCSNSEFHCLSGQCIHKKDVCNGVKDCDDGSDEEGQCGKCKDFGCSHGCSDSPRGPECTCPPLQFLSSDYRTCEVDDLCAFDTHECSQHCAQMYGDVKCYCSEGYDLVNTYECSAKPEFHNGSLFFVYDQNSVRRTQLFNDSAFYEEHVSPIDDGRILSLTFHPSTEQLFMVVDYRRKHRTELTVQNGVTNSVLLTAIDMKYVAIDWITGNIYYAVEAVDPGIGVCSPRGEYCKLLIKGEYLGDHVYTQHYGGLIFHPKRSQIIWLDRNSEHSNGAIFVADTDGQYPRRLDHLNIGYMRTIAIDYVQDHVYVAGDGVLSRIDLHTLKSSNVKADVSPRSMIIFNGHLYFVERNSHILRKRKFGSESAERLHLLKGKDVALAIDNKLYYDMYYNPCDNKQCSHMCVLDRNGSTEVPRAKCICPDQYEMVNGACVYLGTTISRVHLSNSRMAEFCQSGSICKNGGFCAPVKDVAFENPTCICPEGFTGLYCENALESHDENDGSVWLVALWILLGVVISIVVLLCIVFARFPSLRHRAELMIGMNVPIISSPLSKSDINSSRSPIILGTDVNTPPSVSRSQSGDLSSSNFPNPMYNAPSVAPLLTKPAYSESPGY